MQNLKQNKWHKSFFNDLAVEMWNHAIPESYTRLEVNYIKSFIAWGKKISILDIPCGSGRLAIRLASSGNRVTGIDISGENIALLKKSTARKNLPVDAIHADLLTYTLKGKFELAVCMGNSFGYFPENKMRIFTGKVFKALKSGGQFLINTGILAESILPNLEEKSWYEVNGIFFLIENFYQVQGRVLKTEMTFIKDDRVERKTAWQYIFTRETVSNILKDAGFKSIQVFNGLNGDLYKAGDPQAKMVTMK